MGLARNDVAIDDRAFLLLGGESVCACPERGHYLFVGECYIHGL